MHTSSEPISDFTNSSQDDYTEIITVTVFIMAVL